MNCRDLDSDGNRRGDEEPKSFLPKSKSPPDSDLMIGTYNFHRELDHEITHGHKGHQGFYPSTCLPSHSSAHVCKGDDLDRGEHPARLAKRMLLGKKDRHDARVEHDRFAFWNAANARPVVSFFRSRQASYSDLPRSCIAMALHRIVRPNWDRVIADPGRATDFEFIGARIE